MKPTSYCRFVATLPARHVHRRYHDRHYGVPVRTDRRLFERLVLEINQAGLSWETILRKQTAFRKAYDGFCVERVAAYTTRDRSRLLRDASIIRHPLKIDAAIHNARQILKLKADHGSFHAWLEKHRGSRFSTWLRLFKESFCFVGPEIVREFLMSLGLIPGAHDPDCPYASRSRMKNRSLRIQKS